MAGEPVHFEIPSDDIEKGSAFWSGLFGWAFQSAIRSRARATE